VSLQARQGKANGILGDNELLVSGRTRLGFVSTAHSAAHAIEIRSIFYFILFHQYIVPLLFSNSYENCNV
jgi:hypothetical protein